MHPGRRECPQQQGPAGIPQALTDHTFKTVPLGEQDLTSGTWFVCDSLTEKEPQFKKFSQYFISQQLNKVKTARSQTCRMCRMSGSCWTLTTQLPFLHYPGPAASSPSQGLGLQALLQDTGK